MGVPTYMAAGCLQVKVFDEEEEDRQVMVTSRENVLDDTQERSRTPFSSGKWTTLSKWGITDGPSTWVSPTPKLISTWTWHPAAKTTVRNSHGSPAKRNFSGRCWNVPTKVRKWKKEILDNVTPHAAQVRLIVWLSAQLHGEYHIAGRAEKKPPALFTELHLRVRFFSRVHDFI
jgi:hypothetical protein